MLRVWYIDWVNLYHRESFSSLLSSFYSSIKEESYHIRVATPTTSKSFKNLLCFKLLSLVLYYYNKFLGWRILDWKAWLSLKLDVCDELNQERQLEKGVVGESEKPS